MSGFNAYDQALASVLNQAVVGGMPLAGSAPPGSDYSDYMKSGYGSSGSSNAKGMSLYCQNLPYSVTQDEIYELFPTSVNINILIGSDNRPQGTCIVYFGTVQQCEDALNQSRMNPMQIQGRNVRVNINNSDRNPNGAGGGYDKKPSYERGGRGGGGNSRARNEDKICITVFNLPFTVDEVEIQKKFTSSSRVYLKKGHDGRSKGIAVVHFTHPSARDIALMEAASIEMNGRFLRAETGDQSSGGGGGGRNHGNDSFSGGGERRGYGDRGGYRGGGRGGDRGGDRGGNDRGGGGRGGEERGQDRGGERGAPDRGGYDRGFDNSSGYGRRGGGPMGNPGGYQGNPGGGYQGGGGYQPRESYGGGGYNQRDQNQVRGGGGDPYGRPDGGRDFRSQPRGRGGFSRGGGGAGGGGRNDFNARERSPQDGKKPKYGMGSITSAIVKQLPTSGRPMSDSSSSGSE